MDRKLPTYKKHVDGGFTLVYNGPSIHERVSPPRSASSGIGFDSDLSTDVVVAYDERGYPTGFYRLSSLFRSASSGIDINSDVSANAAAFEGFHERVSQPEWSKSTSPLRSVPSGIDIDSGVSANAAAFEGFDEGVSQPEWSKSSSPLRSVPSSIDIDSNVSANAASFDGFDGGVSPPEWSKSSSPLRSAPSDIDTDSDESANAVVYDDEDSPSEWCQSFIPPKSVSSGIDTPSGSGINWVSKKNIWEMGNNSNDSKHDSATTSKSLNTNQQLTQISSKIVLNKCPSPCHLLINNKDPNIYSCSLCHQTNSIFNHRYKFSSEEAAIDYNKPIEYYVQKMKEAFLSQPIARQEAEQKWEDFYNGKNSAKNGDKFCRFCLKNSEKREFCESHCLKDSTGRVTCPVLRALKCPYCYADGDNAHTRKYCPVYKAGNEVLPATRRLANGTLASAKNHK